MIFYMLISIAILMNVITLIIMLRIKHTDPDKMLLDIHRLESRLKIIERKLEAQCVIEKSGLADED